MIIINSHVIAAIVTATILEMACLYKDIRTYSSLLAINLQRDSVDNHKMYDFISHLLPIQLSISLFNTYDYDEYARITFDVFINSAYTDYGKVRFL